MRSQLLQNTSTKHSSPSNPFFPPALIQRAPDPGTASLHEDLTRQYSRETGVPYRPGLQHTEGYYRWLASKKKSKEDVKDEEGKQPSKSDTKGAKKHKDKLKGIVNVGAGAKRDDKGTSGAVSADANLKIPLGGPWLDIFKLSLKTGGFFKYQSAVTGPARDKLEGGAKLQLDMLDLLLGSDKYRFTSGLYLAGSGGQKTEDGKEKYFGSMQTGISINFIYTDHKMWEANMYLTTGFSMFGAEKTDLETGAFLNTGASVYLRGNVGTEEHKVLIGPTVGGGINLDGAQKKAEGTFNAGLRVMF